MNTYILQFLIKLFFFIPIKVLKFFWPNKENIFVSSTFYNMDEWQFNYKASSLIQFFIPLIIDISVLSKKILKIFKTKKLISIMTVLIIYEDSSNIVYTHSLLESNKLYNSENFQYWPINLLINLIEKLELYNSFKKISLVIKVKEITKI